MKEESKLIELFKKYPGIAEDDPHYDDMVNYSGDMLWVYTYADKESLELDYYLNFLEEPETLYTFTENIINLFKSFIK